MDLTRRALLGFAAAAPLVACTRDERIAHATASDDQWARVRDAFELEPGVIDLDNGWSCPTPREVMAAYDRQMHQLVRLPAHEFPRMAHEVTATQVVPALAALLGVPAAEVAITRNTTEGIGTILLGYPFQPGDEVVASTADYGPMLDMLGARIARGEVVGRRVELPVPAPSAQAIVDAYAQQITSKTKLVLITHASSRTGQLAPIAEIAKLAHAHGAEVAVDGAQTFGLLGFTLPELDCDYFATSTHKWLMAPPTGGVLWMRPEHVAKIPARFGGGDAAHPMARYSQFGEAPQPAFTAILDALAFRDRIGAAQIEARMRELAGYLRTALRALPGVRFHTVDDAWASCGIVAFDLPGRDPIELQRTLWERDRVLTQAQAPADAPTLRGLRVTPAIYTSTDELDRAVAAIRRA